MNMNTGKNPSSVVYKLSVADRAKSNRTSENNGFWSDVEVSFPSRFCVRSNSVLCWPQQSLVSKCVFVITGKLYLS